MQENSAKMFEQAYLLPLVESSAVIHDHRMNTSYHILASNYLAYYLANGLSRSLQGEQTLLHQGWLAWKNNA